MLVGSLMLWTLSCGRLVGIDLGMFLFFTFSIDKNTGYKESIITNPRESPKIKR